MQTQLGKSDSYGAHAFIDALVVRSGNYASSSTRDSNRGRRYCSTKKQGVMLDNAFEAILSDNTKGDDPYTRLAKRILQLLEEEIGFTLTKTQHGVESTLLNGKFRMRPVIDLVGFLCQDIDKVAIVEVKFGNGCWGNVHANPRSRCFLPPFHGVVDSWRNRALIQLSLQLQCMQTSTSPGMGPEQAFLVVVRPTALEQTSSVAEHVKIVRLKKSYYSTVCKMIMQM